MAETQHGIESFSLDQLNERVAELAEGVRDFSHGQTDIWRQLPYLALQIQGNGGYEAQRTWLYKYGLYRVSGQAEGLFGIYIDCENGNILSQRGEVDLDNPANNIQVVEAWLPSGGRFDATSILERYQMAAVEPHKSYSSKDEAEVRQWRHETTQQLGLLSIFSRERPAA